MDNSPQLSIIHDEDVQCARAMHPFDPAEFDIAGGRWPRDQRDGMRFTFRQPGNRFGNQSHNLLRSHHAQVPVGHKGERPPPLGRPAIKDDGAGLSDSDGAAGQDAGTRIQVGEGERRLSLAAR